MTPPDGLVAGERAPLPSGTVTFLFSDIEGSTQRWETSRDAMRLAVARHERLVIEAIERHGGYVFKTIGDAFCAAFPTAPQAVKAAIDIDRALAGEDFSSVGGLRVRIGIHTGHAEEREGDYFGPTVNRVSRLMSIGHGGQILLSAVTQALVAGELPAGATLVDLGSHRLKDLTYPEQVWQVTTGAALQAFPPLRSLDSLPHNLPIQHTTFRGREHDLDEVKTLLRQHHLVTLVGPGGIGKTRLGLQAAADVLEAFPDGVWLTDLAAISDPEIIASAVAKVLNVVQSEDHTVDDAVVHWLKRKRLLLILDNCEHVIEGISRLAEAILRTCPEVRLLTTSRQALGIHGEFVYRLSSLDVPDVLGSLSAENALRYGAIALFVDRALASDARFTLTDDNVPGVADICRRLDGIPLAIELAAARVKVLSIPNLAQRLNERFKLLTTGSRTAVPRQKTLSALIDWSYDLLSTQERLLFDRLAVFAGGMSYEAVAAVCTGGSIEEFDLLDLLSSLTDKSLVVAETSGQEERYRLLESTRAYALEKLTASGEQPALARAHARYYHKLADEADRAYTIASTDKLAARLEREVDNFRAAMEWALKAANDVELGAAIIGQLYVLWSDGGLNAEGRWWINAAIAALDEDKYPHAAAMLWRARAMLSAGQRRYEAAQRSFELAERVNDEQLAMHAVTILSSGCLQTGRMEQGLAISTKAAEYFRRTGQHGFLANTHAQLAIFEWSQGDIQAARRHFDEAIALSRGLEDELITGRIKGNYAEFSFVEGEPEKALIAVLEAINIYARSKNFDFLTTFNNNSAAYRIALGDPDGAYAALVEGLKWAREGQSAFDMAVACQHLALLGAMQGDHRSAASVLGYVNEQYRELVIQREYTEKWSYERLTELLAQALPENERTALMAEGAKLSDEQAAAEALKIGKPRTQAPLST